MTEHQSTHKQGDSRSPTPLPASDGEYAAPLDLSMMATGRNHKGILQLQRMIGNRTTQRLLQRENEGSGGSPAPSPAASSGPSAAAAGPVEEKIDPLTVVLNDVEYQTCKGIYETEPNWNNLKAIYMESADKDLRQMAYLWAFRRSYVVGLIKSLRSTKYPNLLAKSAGSNDLSSDYDITLASPGNDNDVKAIEDFNNQVKADFGVQPGTLFDTNLYAKDYGAITQSKEFEETGLVTAKDSAPGETADMLQMEYDVQDVAALLKLRRFMNQTEWDAYVADMLENIDEDKRAAVARKYDEADGIYQICVSTLLGQVREALGEQQEAITLEHAQEENAEQLHEATESHSDTVLEQSNALYLARMSRIRSIQAHTTELETQYAALEALGNVTPALAAMVEAHFQNPNKDLPARIEAERTQVKQLLAEAIYFAAEAYISQGAIRHVVAGIQGTKLSDKEKEENPDAEAQKALMKKKLDAANAKLDMSDLQQSFNEQLGDFLKDYQHLEGAPDGKFYIKSSKYIDRMFDVVLILKGRMGEEFPEGLRIETATGKSFTEIVAAIKELYSARGDPNKWGAARETTSIGIMRDRMGVASRGQLKAVLLGLGSEISALLRNQSPAAADTATERSFFQNRNTAFD